MTKTAALLALALAASPLQAAELEYFTASASGKLTIGADGSVLDVEVTGDRKQKLGKAVEEGFEERIRTWRFEPVTEDGKPVNVIGHMRLSLVAAREKGASEASFGIRQVWFLDPPGTAEGAAGASARHHLPPPIYPRAPMSEGVGAEVMLALKLGASGEVVETGTQSLALTGNVPSGETLRGRHARTLARSAENVSKSWKFEGFEEGSVVLVPVRYSPNFDNAWVRTVAVPTDVPLWVLAREADKTAVKFDGSGQRLSTRIKLETPLADPIDPTAGG
jgi:hypothetical protein